VLCEPKNDEHSDNVVERPQLTASTLKKGLQFVDDLVDNFFEVNFFMDMFLKLKHNMESVMTPYKEVYNYVQKKAKQVMFISLSSLLSPLPPCTVCCTTTLTVLARSNTNIIAMNTNKNVFIFVFCVPTKCTYSYMTL
jgi:hypothetical protein